MSRLANKKYKTAILNEHNPRFEDLVDFILSIPDTETQNTYNVDEAKVVFNVMTWLVHHPLIAITHEGSIVGCIAFEEIEPLWWSSEKCITNPILYIKPEHRSLSNLKFLLEAAKEYAIMKGCEFVPNLYMVDDLSKKERLFTMLGYKKIGATFRK